MTTRAISVSRWLAGVLIVAGITLRLVAGGHRLAPILVTLGLLAAIPGLVADRRARRQGAIGAPPTGLLLPRSLAPLWGAVGFTLMFFLAARTTGAGWLIVLSCLIIGSVVVGVVVPPLTLARIRVRMSGPGDAVAGEPFTLSVAVDRPGLGLLAQGASPPTPLAAVLDGANPIGPVIARRGVIREMTVVISSSAPLGMLRASRRITVPLDHPVHVSPRMGRCQETGASQNAAEGEMAGSRPTHGDRLRSVREYADGDAMRLIHWPASARRGDLVVKELESPASPHLHLVVALTGVPEVDDPICDDAMATAVRALEDGRSITLHTNDGTGARVTPVRRPRDAGRCLAAADAGAVPEPHDAYGRIVRLTAPGAP